MSQIRAVVACMCFLSSLAACDKSVSSPHSTAPNSATLSASSTQAPPPPNPHPICFAPGFSYDADDRIEGHEDWVTIRLGDDVRIWFRPTTDTWSPATLALLNEAGAAVLSIRIDLPPSGSVTGTLPEPSDRFAQVRFCWVTMELDPANFERRIGVSERELPNSTFGSSRVMAADIAIPVHATNPSADLPASINSDFVSIKGEQTVPMCIVIDGIGLRNVTSYIGPWSDESRPITDERWMERGLGRYLGALASD